MKNYRWYHQYSEYSNVWSGLKRLDFMYDAITKHGEHLRVLDLGCGCGNISRAVAAFPQVDYVLGVDIDAASLEYARSRNTFDNLEFKSINLFDMPDLGAFDVIIASEVLEHLGDPLLMINLLKSYSHDNTFFIFTIPNGYSIMETFMRLVKRYPVIEIVLRSFITSPESAQSKNTGTGGRHVQNFSRRSFSNLVSNAGLKILESSNSDTIFGWIMFTLFGKCRLADSLEKLDCTLANHLLPTLAGGWFFVLKKSAPTISNIPA